MPRSKSILSSCTALPGVEVRDSHIHGLGVFALVPLARGATIGWYDGRRYTARQSARVHWDDRLTYLFGLSDGTTIDGGQGGNATRHLNHACSPNCEAIEETGTDGRLSVRIVTLRRMRAGTELFIDYSLTADETARPDDYACHCGSPACRGTMLAPADA